MQNDKLDSFIEQIIKEYQEHFKKGNVTLGTLPNDWKTELYQIVYDFCELQKQKCAKRVIESDEINDFRLERRVMWRVEEADNVCEQ